MNKGTFEIKDRFYRNGDPFQIISGGLHYFRVIPEYWQDRLEKLKALGCNTVETYVPWNLHEPEPGRFDFSGIRDLQRFLEIAVKLDLCAIVRPSPYICAEWEFGGLPAWLLAEDGMRLRVSDPRFLQKVERYYRTLFQILSPMQITNGGPIILFQIENEYGYYGNDKTYLEALRKMMIENGVNVPFVTSDGPWGDAIESGSLPGALPTGNFGSKTEEQFAALRKHTDGPLMCMEFWVGWFDSWGCGKHSTTSVESCSKEFDDMLRLGNTNLYMFHGGTNFGFMNGANYYETLTPDVTSYDYDALLSESGDITPKYEAFRKVIAKYAAVPQMELPPPIPKKDYGVFPVQDQVSLFSVLEELSCPVKRPYTLSMEQCGQSYGYILYRTHLGKGTRMEKVRLLQANDRAILFGNGARTATLYDRELLEEITLDFTGEPDVTLDILMENMGRVNFAQNLEHQRKGISEGMVYNGHFQNEWEMYPLPLDNVEQIDFSKEYIKGNPAFYRIPISIDEPCDTFLDVSGWGKGVAFINGFNLGRFWDKGPQKRLYLPAPLLKRGENVLILFETEGVISDHVALRDQPDLG